MRKIAQNKASVLLQKIPSGVVMVDENLKIIDCNRQFAELLGKETVMIFDSNPGMAGADLRKLVSFHKLFSSLLLSGEEKTENDIREGDNYYHVSVVNIQNYKIACGIIQNLRNPEIQKEVFAQRINEVVRQNMEAVQRIAYLLGENASFTEATLNSITDSLGQSASIESNTR
jgi:PAS domain-containing protein